MEDLLKTVGILAVCLVYLTKQIMDSYTKRKNGKSMDSCQQGSQCARCTVMAALLDDLHRWHKPVTDPITGQPRFMWYGDSIELQKELERSRESTEELKTAMEAMNDSIRSLVEQIRNCPGARVNQI